MIEQVAGATQIVLIGLIDTFGEKMKIILSLSLTVLLALAGCTLAPSPKPTTSPLPTPTPTPDFGFRLEQSIQAAAVADNNLSIECSDNAPIDTGIVSLEPVTGTITFKVRLYAPDGYVGMQIIPNESIGGALLAQQNGVDCMGNYATLPYNWDYLESPLVPGRWYIETIAGSVVLEHTAPISITVNGELVAADDVMGWYQQDGQNIVYYGPDEEVFFRTFRVAGTQIYLPVIYK